LGGALSGSLWAVSVASGLPAASLAGTDCAGAMAVPHGENHEEVDAVAMAAAAATYGIAEEKEIAPVSGLEMGGSDISRSALAAVSDHRAPDLLTKVVQEEGKTNESETNLTQSSDKEKKSALNSETMAACSKCQGKFPVQI
jgi:hypothetical protein